MYLHYYLNEKYVGVVDIEVFFDAQNRKTLIYCTEECEDLLGALELVYGKRIEKFSRADAWDLRHHVNKMRDRKSNYIGLPAHVFTTKKCGPFLAWSDLERVLMCNA